MQCALGQCNVVEDFNDRTLLFPSPPKVLTYLSSCVKCNMVFVMIEQKYCTVQSRFSDILFSDKSRFSDNFAEDRFFST